VASVLGLGKICFRAPHSVKVFWPSPHPDRKQHMPPSDRQNLTLQQCTKSVVCGVWQPFCSRVRAESRSTDPAGIMSVRCYTANIPAAVWSVCTALLSLCLSLLLPFHCRVDDVSQRLCKLDCLDWNDAEARIEMLWMCWNVKMMLIGSSTVCQWRRMMALGRGDIRWGPGWIMSRRMWKILAYLVNCRFRTNGGGRWKVQPMFTWRMAIKMIYIGIWVCVSISWVIILMLHLHVRHMWSAVL